jgi:predicted extracellular nuclease
MLATLLPLNTVPAGATDGDHLLLSEIVVTPTAGELIEIHNPTGWAIDLSDYYVTDATFAGGGTFYYNIVTGTNAGGGGFDDFHARFPNGASIAAGEYQTIALNGSTNFSATYGALPTYELYEDDGAPDAVPNMREALPGSINNQGGLSNNGEVVILYTWNGSSDLVQDIDYVLWGDKAEAVDKTGVSIDGPDGDAVPSTYKADTAIGSQEVVATGGHSGGESFQRIDPNEGTETSIGGNGINEDDETSENLPVTWETAEIVLPPPTPATIMEIQGTDRFSPLQGLRVDTTGVVTVFTANGANCWIQDPIGDGDAATSDGIFVSGCGFPATGDAPRLGDEIRLVASVDEQQFGNALPLTRLVGVESVEILSSGNKLPKPVELKDLPDVSIGEGEIFWEQLEGMLVAVKDGRVVAPTNRFGEFAMLAKENAKPGSGYEPSVKQILLRSIGVNEVDYNPERIVVDDSTLDDAIQVRPGDRIQGFVGVVDYTFGMYKLQPADVDKVQAKKLPKSPVSTRSGPNGDTVITTYNVENLFDLVLNTGAVDIFGEVGFDPGSSWGPPFTRDNTLVRKPDVCAGRTANGPFDPSVEWVGTGNNNFGDLGTHTTTCTAASELFISEYIEGSSNNKAVEIYNGTGSSVDLASEGYAIDIYFNGSESPGTRVDLTGTLAPGDVWVLADDGADAAILTVADQTSTSSFFNGDDAVVLRRGEGKDDASSTPSPEELETQLTKLALSIEKELRLPEIMVLQEVENTAIAQELGDRVNAANGTDYVAVSYETSDGRGIEVAFLYDDNRVDLLDSFQLSGPDVEAAFGPSSPSPGREPLYGKFQIGDEIVHIVGNHFKSKGGDDPIYGVSFERITEIQRKAQAQVVRDFVDGLDSDALVMVTGDLNDFQFGEPDEGPDHPIAILEGVGGGETFTNLIFEEKAKERWTFIFDGNSQVLDHMLVNDALLEFVAGVDILHFNASFPSAVGADPATTIRASDHDPIEGRFVFGR